MMTVWHIIGVNPEHVLVKEAYNWIDLKLGMKRLKCPKFVLLLLSLFSKRGDVQACTKASTIHCTRKASFAVVQMTKKNLGKDHFVLHYCILKDPDSYSGAIKWQNQYIRKS